MRYGFIVPRWVAARAGRRADPAVGTMFPPHHAARAASDRVRYEALLGVGGIHLEAPDRVIDEITIRLTYNPR